MAYTKEIVTLSVEIGDAMLRSGAEIYRVEDTVIHILEAYEIEQFDVYVLSNGIWASANEGKEDGCSMVRHVPLAPVHLGRVAELNQLARDICNKDCSLIDAWERLEECKNIPQYKNWVRALSCAVGSATFCYMFGGHIYDAAAALLIGFLEELLLIGFGKLKWSRIVSNVFAATFVTIASLLVCMCSPMLQMDKIVIGSIMILVPGIALTTSIRDFNNGDYLSGTIHLIDALLTALCIATGVAISIFAFSRLGGGALL